MARRHAANATMDNVQTIHSILDQVGKSFQAKVDPMKCLADEIEVR
jgi:hypothetical protein